MAETLQDPSFHFIWLEVSDLLRTVDFYREMLGFPVQDETGAFGIVHLAHGQIYLSPGTPRPFSGYFAIAVPDIEAMRQRLLQQGIQAPEPTDEGWARYLNLVDPDGYRLILLQPAEETA